MKKKLLIIACAGAMAFTLAACSETDVTEESSDTTEYSEETTVETTETEEPKETDEASVTTPTGAEADPLFNEYMRIMKDPNPTEPENPQEIKDLPDEELRTLAQSYADDGYELEATAEELYEEGSGYAWPINYNDYAFLIRGFWMIKQEDDHQISVWCYKATRELCETYLGYQPTGESEDEIEYSDSRFTDDDTKITFDKNTGVLTITYTTEHLSQGVG